MIAKITIKVSPPEKCTKKEFEEWLRFQLGVRDTMSIKNPLVDHDLDLEDNVKSGDYDLSYELLKY